MTSIKTHISINPTYLNTMLNWRQRVIICFKGQRKYTVEDFHRIYIRYNHQNQVLSPAVACLILILAMFNSSTQGFLSYKCTTGRAQLPDHDHETINLLPFILITHKWVLWGGGVDSDIPITETVIRKEIMELSAYCDMASKSLL